MCVVFDKVDHEEFESEEKTENGSSFVRHFDERPSKTAKKLGVFPHICEVVPPTHFVVRKKFLHHFNNSSIANRWRIYYGDSILLSGDIGP